MNNCENCFDISPMIGRLVGVTRTMRLALYKGEGVPTGTPQDLTGLTVVVRVLRDGTADIFLPEFVIEGNDNNIVKFVWPATEQAVGNYTFDVTFTDGGINVNRIDWHGPRGMRLVEHSYQVYGDDSFGVKSNEEIGLIGYFTTSGVGMSAFEVWVASPESEGYEKTVEGFMAYLRQPATDAAEEAEADHERAVADHAQAVADHVLANADHETAAADHTRAGNDHDTASGDHTRAESDHTQAVTDSQRAASDHQQAVSDVEKAESDRTKAAQDRQRAAADHGIASTDHDTAATDHQQAQSDHTKAAEDHTQAVADYEQAARDHTRAENDHDTASNDHVQAEDDHTRAEADHTAAAADHTAAAADHEQAANDHTQASTDHTTAASDHTRAEQDHTKAGQDSERAATDHSRAESDHSTAAQDHTTAASDHTLAGQDHSTAAQDHTQAGSDHERAESDHSRAEEDHASIADKVSHEELAVAIEPLARKDGSYDTMSVGLAKNLEGRTNVTDSFFERTTGGDAEVANGLAQMTEVGGNSVKFNQLAWPYNSEGWVELNTVKTLLDGSKTVRVTPNSDSGGLVKAIKVYKSGSLLIIPGGHKYYLSGNIETSSQTTTASYGFFDDRTNASLLRLYHGGGEKTRYSIIGSFSSTAYLACRLGNSALTSEYADFSNMTCIDLTAIF